MNKATIKEIARAASHAITLINSRISLASTKYYLAADEFLPESEVDTVQFAAAFQSLMTIRTKAMFIQCCKALEIEMFKALEDMRLAEIEANKPVDAADGARKMLDVLAKGFDVHTAKREAMIDTLPMAEQNKIIQCCYRTAKETTYALNQMLKFLEAARAVKTPAADVTGLSEEQIAKIVEQEALQPGNSAPTARGYLVRHIDEISARYVRLGLEIEERTALYHLDTCRSWGVLAKSDYLALHEVISNEGSFVGDYSVERNQAIIDALREALLTGGNINTVVKESSALSRKISKLY